MTGTKGHAIDNNDDATSKLGSLPPGIENPQGSKAQIGAEPARQVRQATAD